MKVAVVIDDLIQNGGQERLFKAVLEIWPDAHVFSPVISDEWQHYLHKHNSEYSYSFMQRIPFVFKIYRYLAPFMLFNLAFDTYNFSKFDLVISVSSRFSHNIITRPGTMHISYVNSPARMFWESADYFERENYGLLKPIKFLARYFLKFPLSYLRASDYAAAQRVTKLIANSNNIAAKVKKYYHRNADVVYPFFEKVVLNGDRPVNINKLKTDRMEAGKYFVVLTRLAEWKRVDIAVEACLNTNTPLKIIGNGPALPELRRKAKASTLITFYPDCDDNEKVHILKNARGLIQTQAEDFGIVPIEALSLGVPVIAYAKGGVLETLIDGQTGVFFDRQTPDSLIRAMDEFSFLSFDKTFLQKRAELFSKSVFQAQLKEKVDNYLNTTK